MAEELLGVGFDIHGGGSDLVFPHHENEAAQTRCGRGAELARIWMHNGMLQLSGEKMAKSVGNIELLGDALERWGRDALILFFASGHYRQPLQYSDETLTQAQRTVERIREAGRARRGRADPDELQPGGDAFFERSPTTSTPPARSRSCSTGSARPTSAAAGAGDPARGDALRPRASRTSSRAGGEPGPPRPGAARPAPGRRAPPRTSPRPTGCATSWPPAAGRSATAPTGAELVPLEP